MLTGPSTIEPSDDVRDAELMRRLQCDDPAAFEHLVQLYWRPLLVYAEKLLGNADNAEDAVQNAFVRIWKRRVHWQPTGTVRAYLYRVVRNLALDERKWTRVRDRWLERWTGATQAPDAAITMERRDLALAMKRAIATLPPRRREVFLLVRHHDLSYRQVAEIMGISLPTVANQMASALATLRDLLAPYYEQSLQRPRRTPPGD